MASYLGEFIGTLVFLTIILKSGNDKYVIALGLLAALLFMGLGHYNPAITFMDCVSGGCDAKVACGLVAAQLAGAYLALRVAAL